MTAIESPHLSSWMVTASSDVQLGSSILILNRCPMNRRASPLVRTPSLWVNLSMAITHLEYIVVMATLDLPTQPIQSPLQKCVLLVVSDDFLVNVYICGLHKRL